jgi:hypothetical protein
LTVDQITAAMPLVAAQAGVWRGEYVHLDADHNPIDRHRSTLICRLFDGPDGSARLAQTNIYDWADGSREIRFFDGVLRGDRIVIANENIDGWVAPLAMDATQRTIMVLWTRTAAPDFRYYEMITVAADGRAKNRTWHWYDKGRLFQRTLINEDYISADWRAYDDPAYYAYRPRAMP